MSIQEMEKELRRLMFVLINDTREEFMRAKKKIESLWNRETKAFKAGAHVALEFLPLFDQIKNDANKEAFASGLGLFFLVLSDEHFDTLKNFVIKVIQHKNGHIREAIRHTAEWLFISLTSRAEPFVFPEGKELTDAQKAEQANGRAQYVGYVQDIEALIDTYGTDDEKGEYIHEMKPSVHKSLQQLWGRLTDNRAYQKLLEATLPIPYEIFIKRKEIEHELLELLKEHRSDSSVDDIKDIIYHEEESGDMMKIISLFDRGSAGELSDVLELVSDAWNYFPHKTLNGISPQEKLLEYEHAH
ncbi:MAG: hypothetical protein UX81_C0040G0008 [Parcubacteria group bacterium GW2011_GWA2_47_12]|nr:MAG: hypothetical protein UX81_C0040G0008 [Parcubacteria group bacterium GW2011_GWA2_47_12]